MPVRARFETDFEDFHRETRKAESELSQFEKAAGATSAAMSKLARGLATDLAAMFTVRAAARFVGDVIEQASALQDLSNQTHINVEEIQRLAGAMSEFGVDADTLAKGLFGLSRRIAAGDDSVELALRKMGLSLSSVKDLGGEELFLTIEHGLTKLQGGLRDTTASDLFGSKLGMAMAGAADGIDTALDAAKRLNTVMSQESVEALDRYGESIERAQRSLGAMAANMLGPLAEGFNVLFEAATRGASKWEIAMSLLPKGLGLVGTGSERLTTLIDELNRETEQHIAAVTQSTSAHTDVAAAIHKTAAELKAEHEEVKALTDAWVAGDKIMSEFSIKTHAIAMTNMREERLERQKLLNERNQAVVDGLKQTQTVEQEYADFVAKQTLSTSDYQIMKIWDVAGEQIRAFKGTEEQLMKFSDAIYTYAQAQAEAVDVATDAITTTTMASAIAAKDAYVSAFDRSAAAFEQFKGVVVAGTGEMTMAIGGNTTAWDRQQQLIRDQFNRGEFFMLGGGGAPPTGQHRESGGPVSAGQSYLVGERGPELFRPHTSGSILPTGRGQPITVQLVVDGRVLAEVVQQHTTRNVMQNTKLGSA
jgi:hypothetical protein